MSQAFWCSLAFGNATFQPAQVAIGKRKNNESIAWLDELLDGGFFLPEKDGKPLEGKPLTVLLTGPPGSGKTTLALEICYRLAKTSSSNAVAKDAASQEALMSLYVSADAETDRLILK